MAARRAERACVFGAVHPGKTRVRRGLRAFRGARVGVETRGAALAAGDAPAHARTDHGGDRGARARGPAGAGGGAAGGEDAGGVAGARARGAGVLGVPGSGARRPGGAAVGGPRDGHAGGAAQGGGERGVPRRAGRRGRGGGGVRGGRGVARAGLRDRGGGRVGGVGDLASVGARVVRATTPPWHTPSRRVLEKCGFEEVGVRARGTRSGSCWSSSDGGAEGFERADLSAIGARSGGRG